MWHVQPWCLAACGPLYIVPLPQSMRARMQHYHCVVTALWQVATVAKNVRSVIAAGQRQLLFAATTRGEEREQATAVAAMEGGGEKGGFVTQKLCSGATVQYTHCAIPSPCCNHTVPWCACPATLCVLFALCSHSGRSRRQ